MLVVLQNMIENNTSEFLTSRLDKQVVEVDQLSQKVADKTHTHTQTYLKVERKIQKDGGRVENIS